MIISFGSNYPSPLVLCLGFFDCVHVAHREIIKLGRRLADEQGAQLAVFTFDNNPFQSLNRSGSVIYTFEDRLQLLSDMGVDCVLRATASPTFFRSSPTDFLVTLCNSLQLKALVVGEDYTYGNGGKGNADTLKRYMEKQGIDVNVVPLFTMYGRKISSSNIRALLQEGHIEIANTLLSQPYFMRGTVAVGRKIGGKLGFPTANIAIPPSKVILKYGVYYTTAIIDGREYPAITNVGNHPTFGDYTANVETHVVGYTGDCYNKELTLYFHQYMRSITCFDTPELLKEQLKRDAERAAREYAMSHGNKA